MEDGQLKLELELELGGGRIGGGGSEGLGKVYLGFRLWERAYEDYLLPVSDFKSFGIVCRFGQFY